MSYPLENFLYYIDGEKKELEVIGNIIIRAKEYLIAYDGENKYVFYISEDETLELIEDEDIIDYILKLWREENYSSDSVLSNWDDEGYIDNEEDTEEASEDQLHIMTEEEEDDFFDY